MQGALDATALMLARDAKSLSSSEIQSRAEKLFASLYNRSETLSVQINSTYSATTGRLVLTGNGVLKTHLASVLGMSQMNIATRSQIATAGANLEIALVLDNTGSMSSAGKMEALKAASKMFIGELKKATQKPGDIKISIVPFNTRVKIGTAYKSAPWIDFSALSYSEKQNWDGCVIDRDKSYDVSDTAPTSAATKFPADRSSCALPEILPLTTDFTLAISRLGQMKPAGRTNTTIGLAWGWHALSTGVPLTEATSPSASVAKYIVFLTDGQNTENRWTTNTNDIDKRTELVCSNLRTAGIKVFTIRVKEGNAALLKSCATEPNMYFDVPAVSEMMAVFKNIAGNISRLRIAK